MISLTKFLLLLGGILLLSVLYLIFYHLANRQKNKQQRSILRKLLRVMYVIIVALYILILFGHEVGDLGLMLGSVLGLVAIGFVAVWSILSNIIAGVIIFISKPFVIGSQIKFVDLPIKGSVDEITMFYIVLEDSKKNLIHIPNNLVFQRAFIHIVQKNKKN